MQVPVGAAPGQLGGGGRLPGGGASSRLCVYADGRGAQMGGEEGPSCSAALGTAGSPVQGRPGAGRGDLGVLSWLSLLRPQELISLRAFPLCCSVPSTPEGTGGLGEGELVGALRPEMAVAVTLQLRGPHV